MNFKFEVGQIVAVKGVECKILERDAPEGKPDYLCRPLDPTQMVDGQWELGAGWVFETNIEPIRGAK